MRQRLSIFTAIILTSIAAGLITGCKAAPNSDQGHVDRSVEKSVSAAVDNSSIEDKSVDNITATYSQSVDDIDFTQYSRKLASFTDLRQGQSRIAAIDIVRLLFAPDNGRDIIKTRSAELTLEGGAVMLLSAYGLKDDSISAQEFYLIFEGNDNTQTLADYGLRVKCARGDNITEWQKEICP